MFHRNVHIEHAPVPNLQRKRSMTGSNICQKHFINSTAHKAETFPVFFWLSLLSEVIYKQNRLCVDQRDQESLSWL